MPKAYLKMKEAMQKEYGKKEGERIAAATFNKMNKGVAHVGRGEDNKRKGK